jgi:hypothetical protein
MRSWEWDWFIGWTCGTVTVLGIVAAVYFGVQSTNEKYYASMDKCIAAGGSFIPQSQGNAICMMGNK